MADNSKFRPNRAKELLKQGKPTLGTWLCASSCLTTEAMSYVGFDWLVVDMEHSPHSYEAAENMIRTIERTDVTPLARVPWNDPVLIKKTLDRGAMGVVIPMVNSREEAESAVRSCMFPPLGVRGIGGGRITRFDLDDGEYMRKANENILVIIQIESEKAIADIDDILSVEGLGAAFIGPADLSASLGIFGQLDNPKFEDAAMKVLAAGNKHDVPVGMHLSSPDMVGRRINQGFRFMALADDTEHMINGAKSAFLKVSEICGNKVGFVRHS